MANKGNYIWRARKRNKFGLPWTFTVYMLTDEKLMTDTGVLNKKLEEVWLYRIVDMTVKKSLLQRIFGLGTIHFCTTDKSTPEFDLVNLKNVEETKELISKTAEDCKRQRGFTVREFMSGPDDIDGHDNMM